MLHSSLKHQAKISAKKARKRDALALAELIYDIFKEQGKNGKIEGGQNNAKQTKNTERARESSTPKRIRR